MRPLRLRRRGLRVALIATALLVGAAGVAYGTSALTGSPAVIQACQNKTNGDLRVVGDNATQCRTSETALAWNSQGAAGPAGPAGPAGANGETGPAGPAGASGASNGRVEVPVQNVDWASATVEPPLTTVLSVPGIGDFTGLCTTDAAFPGTEASQGVGFFNTSAGPEDVVRGAATGSRVVQPGNTGEGMQPNQVHATTTETWLIGSGTGATAHTLTLIIASSAFRAINGLPPRPCVFQWSVFVG